MEDKKDIILVIGDGGMMGVFVAGALSAINEGLRSRISAVYGTSSGADVGAYFVSGQMDRTLEFFTEYLTRPEFCRKNFLRYLLKVFIFRRSRIPDYLNVDYVVDVAKHSECKLDLSAFERSNIEFHVKVIELSSPASVYLSAKTNVFEKLKATSQCGPLSTKAIEIDRKRYIDGGTVPSDLDVRLAKENSDKTVIFVRPQKESRFSKALLYPLYLLAGHATSILYGKQIGRAYAQNLFRDYDPQLKSCKNLIFIENDLRYSSFCTDTKKLQEVYEHGLEKGRKAFAAL